MPLLQRSCQACVKARRRCNLASPSCQRCSAKRITCRYINDPAPVIVDTREINHVKPFKRIRKLDGGHNSQNLAHLMIRGALDTSLQIRIRQVLHDGFYQGSRPPVPVSDPYSLPDLNITNKVVDTGLQIFYPLHLEVIRVFDQATLHHLSDILRSFPPEFSEHGTTSFIHSGLYGSRLPPQLQDIRDVCLSYEVGGEYHASNRLNALRLTIQRLLRSAKRANSFADTLAYAQAISLAQIIRLLECHDLCEDEVEYDNAEMWSLTHRLWQYAPTQLPSTLSPWQAWLFSENVRRTIMVCNILLGVYSSLRRGYTMHSLCVEALPFDARTRLWEADSEASWSAAASRTPNPSLVTLSQFTALQRPANGGTRFEDLLLLSFRK